ncbi:MAG: Sortase (surface protein transpeptidase) [uncultured Rubrobacteraceae bacterium]|uniref:Sortase (Surface protein transpeptidase) n=1 Tax=uncultured Rubrobacteraceae bacterium TaxID=349277 RepID=A0A6J4QSF7_9ACTN|nr:MAG: Sortase (surface protein transpeptidase) [uncultured Rubrobacteraceae bacterium]
MRAKDIVLSLISLALIGAGVFLIATFFMGSGLGGDSSGGQQDFTPPIVKETTTVSEKGPSDNTLRLTIPKMDKISDAEIPTAEGNDEEKLKNYAAIHLEGTDYPWEKGSNVYIAGHRLGYPETSSFLAFYDLDNLEKGDVVIVADADGTEYTYEVYQETIVGPFDLSVTEPVEGKDVLTLQTCTLPDYSQRLIVQAEKVV